MRTQHFNIFNTGTESFFTPGTQLANIAAVKPDAPAVIYVSPENKESVMTWRELHELSNRIAWYLLGQGVGPRCRTSRRTSRSRSASGRPAPATCRCPTARRSAI